MKVNIEDVSQTENNISFLLNIVDINNETYYFTNLHNPYYKIDEDILYVYFSQFEIPEEVCMDFPEIKGDEILNNDIFIKIRIFFDENNYVPHFLTTPESSDSGVVKNAILQRSEKSQYDKRVFGEAKNSKLKFATIFLTQTSNVPFEEKPKTTEMSKIKKIVFVFGYLKEYDKKILDAKLEDSIKQREKFYYVVKRQELLYREIVFPK